MRRSKMTQQKYIGHEIKVLAQLIKRSFDRNMTESPPKDATAMHSYIIGYLYHHRDRDVFQRDIEQQFHIRRSTATGILQCMEKNGCIVRRSVDYDARLKKIILTEKSVAMHEKIMALIDQTEATLMEGISEEEMDCFFRVIDKMKQNLEVSG